MRIPKHVPKIDTRGIDIALLAKVERAIRRHPENYDQTEWFYSDAEHRASTVIQGVLATKHLTGPVCGTTACVAGHALLRSGRIMEFVNRGDVLWLHGAKKVLGINGHLATWLFSDQRFERTMPQVLAALRNGANLNELRDLEMELNP